MSRRVDLRPADRELSGLVRTINGLLARLEQAFKDLRDFTADASHQLQTSDFDLVLRRLGIGGSQGAAQLSLQKRRLDFLRARGDAQTVARQRDAVASTTPAHLALWDALADATARLATGRVPSEAHLSGRIRHSTPTTAPGVAKGAA